MGQDARKNALELRHQELEHQVEAEEAKLLPDDEALARLKRQKLRIKDELATMEAP